MPAHVSESDYGPCVDGELVRDMLDDLRKDLWWQPVHGSEQVLKGLNELGGILRSSFVVFSLKG